MQEKTTVAVIGSGTMGRGIAQVAVQSGCRVLLYDSDAEVARQAVARIVRNLDALTAKGKLEERQARAMEQDIAIAHRLEDVASADFILEAIVEDLQIKKALFQKLDALTGGRAILASNTSSIPISELAEAAAYPEKIIGMHFMNPVPLMAGVEIVRGRKTSDDTYRATRQLAETFTKIPIYSSDRAGFVVNRILMPMINEAIAIVDEGTSDIESVDRGAVHCLNHPLGPLALSDLIGNDTVRHILCVMAEELGERFKPSSLLAWMVQAGWCGNKNGAGFYLWRDNKPQGVNPAVGRYLNDKAR